MAAVAFEVLEQESWGKRHTWLMVTTDPWGFLTDLVVGDIRAAYRSSVRAGSDSKKLKRIAKASTRAELGVAASADDVDADACDDASEAGESA